MARGAGAACKRRQLSDIGPAGVRSIRVTNVVGTGRPIDGSGADVKRHRALCLQDRHIREIGPGTQILSDAHVLDLRDYSVLRCLIDAHVHLVFSALANALADVLAKDDQMRLTHARRCAPELPQCETLVIDAQ